MAVSEIWSQTRRNVERNGTGLALPAGRTSRQCLSNGSNLNASWHGHFWPQLYVCCCRKAVHAELVTSRKQAWEKKITEKTDLFVEQDVQQYIYFIVDQSQCFGNKGDTSFLLALLCTKAVAVLLLLVALCQVI